jgi:RsiW-degrading membrane proteinase PrsW (M82 family)
MTEPELEQVEEKKEQRPSAWWRALLIGAVLYILGLGTLFLTNNPNLFPTVVMIGSFLVPVAYVAFFYERRHLSKLTMPTTAMSLIYGGLLGVIAASILEPIFVQKLDTATAFIIGLIEEFAKILGVLVVARRWRHDSEIDGIILGAAAGMGFAALESSGYAFTAFMQSNGNLSATVGVTLLRGLLSPLGHGTWTAILAAVLFRESRGGHFRINLKVVGAYFTAVILHGLWDAVPAALSAYTVAGIDVFVGQVLVGLPGLLILWRRWHEGMRLQLEQAEEAEAVSPSLEEISSVAEEPAEIPLDGHWVLVDESDREMASEKVTEGPEDGIEEEPFI